MNPVETRIQSVGGTGFRRDGAKYHPALAEFFKGNPESAIEFLSRGHDVSLANPFGGIARGREEAAKRAKLAATYYKDVRSVTIDNVAKSVSHDLGYIVR